MKLLHISLFASLTWTASSAYASLRELADRENKAQALSTAFYRYEQVRDQMVLGDKGYVQKVRAYSKDAETWLFLWHSEANSANLFKGDLLASSQAVSQLLRKQALGYQRLSQTSEQLETELSAIETQLGSTKGLVASEQLTPQVERLQSLIGGLFGKTRDLLSSIKTEQQAIKKMQNHLSADFFLLRLKDQAISKGLSEQEPVFQEASAFLTAELWAAPLLADIQAASDREVQEMLRFEVFALKTSLPAFSARCAEAQTSLTAAPLAGAQRKRLQLELSEICSGVQTRYEQTIRPYSIRELLTTMHRTKIRINRRFCGDIPSATRCDLYQRLAQVDIKTLQTYNEESLGLLEGEWHRFEESIR